MQKRNFRKLGWCTFSGALLVLAAAYYLHWRTTRFDELIESVSNQYGLDFNLVKSLIYEESWFDPDARGESGELGLMQVTGTVRQEFLLENPKARKREPELLNPVDNLEVGCWYLRGSLDLFKSFREPLPLALARYNAGESRVRNWIRSVQGRQMPSVELSESLFIEAIDIPSTRDYVTRVLKRYRSRGSAAAGLRSGSRKA